MSSENKFILYLLSATNFKIVEICKTKKDFIFEGVGRNGLKLNLVIKNLGILTCEM